MPLTDPWLPQPDESGYIATYRTATPTRVTRRTDSMSGGTTTSPGGGPALPVGGTSPGGEGTSTSGTDGTATTNPVIPPGQVASYQTLDNVGWLSIVNRIGDDPGTATLRYRFGTNDPDAPANFEEALSDTFTSPKTIEPGDRIVIFATRPDGVEEPIFDGFALEFGGVQSGETEGVEIKCLGVGYRLRDAPISGSEWRQIIAGVTSYRDTDVEPHFNPKGMPNREPGTVDEWGPIGESDPDKRYPAFVDTVYVGDPSFLTNKGPKTFRLPDAARYLLWKYNRLEAWVKNTKGGVLDSTLIGRIPIDGIKYDPKLASSFTEADIEVPDKPVGGKDLASTVRAMIRGKGFEVAFRTAPEMPGGLDPATTLDVFMPQLRTPVDVWLQPRGSTLDLSLTNVANISVARDLSGVANEWTVEGDLGDWEVSFVLGAGWSTNPNQDLTVPGLQQFNKTTLGYKVNDFRYWIVGEGGETVYKPGTATDYTNLSLASFGRVFGSLIDDGHGKLVYPYVERNRVMAARLLTLDDRRKPLHATLAISTDYGGLAAQVWDGTSETAGTWQPILGGWELLKDRIGIYINCPDVNAWAIGKATQVGYPFPKGIVNVVECLVKQNAAIQKPYFYLRLTCVIKGDRRLKGTANRKLNNVLPTAIGRTLEARDRYMIQTIHAGSEFQAAATVDVVTRDDTPLAAAEAQAIQAVTQNGQLNGPLVIPRFTRAYEVGDPIQSVNGRGLAFRTDSDGEDAVPTLPIATEIVWSNDGQQTTTIHTSDADAARPTLSRTRSKASLFSRGA